ncbi:hypothetical protein SLS62_011270 [Diatrype stigma]|uniref:Uncharacterized protein n=1 Tax=Diatrype stigma TaxID=117547 RepID=A0AAN9U425_9PEZI
MGDPPPENHPATKQPPQKPLSSGGFATINPRLPYFTDLADAERKYPHFTKARACYYSLVLCWRCGRSVGGDMPPAVGGGQVHIKLKPDRSDARVMSHRCYERHGENRHRACLQLIVGAEREFGAACSDACRAAIAHDEAELSRQERAMEEAAAEARRVRDERAQQPMPSIEYNQPQQKQRLRRRIHHENEEIVP